MIKLKDEIKRVEAVKGNVVPVSKQLYLNLLKEIKLLRFKAHMANDWNLSLKEKEMAQNMCEKIKDSAKGFEADMLITAYPLCMYNLKKNGNGDLPVYYFTELLAEALGVKEEVAK